MEALLVIDIQPETVKPRSAESLIQDWNAIIGTYDPGAVAYVANLGPFSKIPQGNPFAEGLDVVSENIFFKRVPDAFSNPALSGWLEEISADSVRLIGIDGNWCIKSSALGAVRHRYRHREALLPLCRYHSRVRYRCNDTNCGKPRSDWLLSRCFTMRLVPHWCQGRCQLGAKTILTLFFREVERKKKQVR